MKLAAFRDRALGEERMKNLKKCPLLLLILFTGVLFTIVAAVGKQNIYADQEYNPLKAPLLSLLFTGAQDDIYPWQMLSGAEPVSAQKTSKDEPSKDELSKDNDTIQENADQQEQTVQGQDGAAFPAAGADQNAARSGQKGAESDSAAQASAAKPLERLQPLRESTYEEYLNHISADIYGDAGTVRAAEYPFETVTEDYFDDALFIGDSRTVGLQDYTDLSEHADFYCETSLTIYKVLEENFKGKGTILEALSKKSYGKIYLMVGINELGRGTTEDFMAKYTEVVDTLHELCPDAKIMIQGIMHVSEQKSSSDAIFNNSNISARNNAIATLADNVHFFYIDMNEAVCDENGNLNAEYTHDQIHLLGMYNDLWKQFLLEHGVEG